MNPALQESSRAFVMAHPANRLMSNAVILYSLLLAASVALAQAPAGTDPVTDSGSGEVLYNGIRLPRQWPPRISLTKDTVARLLVVPPTATAPDIPYLKNPPEVIPIDVGRQLFVDDFLIEKTDLLRTYHHPEEYQGNPVLKPETKLELGDALYGAHHVYSDPVRSVNSAGTVTIGTEISDGPTATLFQDGVWYDPSDHLFKMWYCAGPLHHGNAVAFATSHDGLKWERPSLDVVPGTNAVLVWPKGHSRDGAAVWLDYYASDPGERFKAYAFDDFYRNPKNNGGGNIFTSPDGIHWAKRSTTSFVSGISDNSSISYNPFRKKWVFSLRTNPPEISGTRCRGYIECDDLVSAKWENDGWVHWANADRLDLPDPEVKDWPTLYNLDMVPYESIMLGMFGIHRGPKNEICEKEGRPKITDLTVAYSRDGFHWHRPDRTAFLACTRKKKDWNRGYLHSAASICAIVGDKIYFYYGAWSGEGGSMSNETGMYFGGGVGVAFLRRDGFASMDAPKKSGALTTRPLTFKGNHLFVNLAAPEGELKVEVMDKDGKSIPGFSDADCEPVRGDKTIVEVKWRKNADLCTLAGKPVRFKFSLTNGSLYSFWVSPDISGASYGYVAAGGPGFDGPIDTIGTSATRTVSTMKKHR